MVASIFIDANMDPNVQVGSKYEKLNIDYPYKDKPNMDKSKCDELYKLFIEKYKKSI